VANLPLDNSLVNRAAPPASMRYFSLLYAPQARRPALTALYVIDAEIRESAQSANHDVAHTRLQWWRQELDRLVNSRPQHPATRVLVESNALPPPQLAKLHELLVAADMDLARMTYSNMRELQVYCARSGGAVQELSALCLAHPQPLAESTRAAANRVGAGVRKVEMLRDLRQDAYEGRIYLPLDDIERNSVKVEDLRAAQVTEPVRAVLQGFRLAIDTELTQALSEIAPAQRATLRPLFVLSALHRGLLARIAARNDDVSAERIELGPLEKPWLAWRAARKAR
jgi:15-cis-phytoene synthase